MVLPPIKGLLLRVFFESADGGYYSPFFGKCYEVLPVPEPIRSDVDVSVIQKFQYSNIASRCSDHPLSKYIPYDYVLIGGSSHHISRVIAHWDPRFDIGVYADYWRTIGGRIPKDFKNCVDCYIFFAAGLARYPPEFFDEKKGFTETRKTFLKSDRGIYVVGYMKVDEIVDLTEISAELSLRRSKYSLKEVWGEAVARYGSKIKEIPHFIRPADLPTIVLSSEGNYRLFKEPIPLIEWVEGYKLLSNSSFTFGIKTFEDRIKYKVYTEEELKEILKTLEKEKLI
ncbi:MAG: hypothetical protein QN229_04705 [Desulfurococcaceae archaeon TW002]